MLDSKAVNLSFLILLSSVPLSGQDVQLTGVLSGYHGVSSQWVRYESPFAQAPSVELTWAHARGWIPQVSVNSRENQLLVTVVPAGQGDAQRAELWEYDIKTKEKKYWASGLEPRQAALFTSWGPLYVTKDLTHKKIYLGKHLLFRKKSELWWPLKVQEDRVYVLSLTNKRMRLMQMSLPSGALKILQDWGSDPVRDFSFVGNTVSYQRQPSISEFVIERLNLVSQKVETIAKFTQPWLAPLSFEDKILFSLSSSASRGRLAIWSKGQIHEGPVLGLGAPIPLRANKNQLVIRRQSESGQDYFLWNSKTHRVQPINTQGKLLESVHFMGGSKP